MSMRVLSMAQFVEIFFAYSVVTLLIPGLLLKEKLKELSFAERLTGWLFVVLRTRKNASLRLFRIVSSIYNPHPGTYTKITFV